MTHLQNKPPAEPDAKLFLTIALAAALKLWGPKQWKDEGYFKQAEDFIAEAEARYGKLPE